jgi:hypothetical protein
MLPGGGTIKLGSNHITPERLVNSYLKKFDNHLQSHALLKNRPEIHCNTDAVEPAVAEDDRDSNGYPRKVLAQPKEPMRAR